MTGPRRRASLPMDILLEIIARCDDVTTVVRCTMTSKALFREILGFLGHRAKASGGFDPGLLTAVSYSYHIDRRTASVAVVQPPGALRRFGRTDLLAGRSSAPMASRDGLVALFQNKKLLTRRVAGDGILVANTITGGVTSLPSMGLQRRGASTSTAGMLMYMPALLFVDGAAGRSFELLVMYLHDGDRSQLVAQIFSSQQGRNNEWGAAHMVHIHGMPPCAHRLKEAVSTAPAVVGRSVHWLCYHQELIQEPNHFAERELIILALHADSAQATVIKLPQEVLTQIVEINTAVGLILAATPAATEGERQMSLVVAEQLVISMWTLLAADEAPGSGSGSGSSISWSRQVVIRRRDIVTPLACAHQRIEFIRFGERSGTVLFWLCWTGLVQLNLGTKKALVLYRQTCSGNPYISQELLHEIDLVSVLRCIGSSF